MNALLLFLGAVAMLVLAEAMRDQSLILTIVLVFVFVGLLGGAIWEGAVEVIGGEFIESFRRRRR